LDELEDIAKDIIDILPSSAIVLLQGNLAAGKTTLVSKIAQKLGAKSATSPTFSLQQIYADTIFHYDFYRVDLSEIVELGLLDEFEKDGLHFVEWGSKELVQILQEAGFDIYRIDIKIRDDFREYTLEVLDA
jgi:tRNA threonylcarbamoyladenosine biosynthesis protein TsaE